MTKSRMGNDVLFRMNAIVFMKNEKSWDVSTQEEMIFPKKTKSCEYEKKKQEDFTWSIKDAREKWNTQTANKYTLSVSNVLNDCVKI